MYTDQDIANLVARVQQLEQQAGSLPYQGQPKLGITSKNFLTRAFSAWGLTMIAWILIYIGITCIAVIISLIVGASLMDAFGDLFSNFPQF